MQTESLCNYQTHRYQLTVVDQLIGVVWKVNELHKVPIIYSVHQEFQVILQPPLSCCTLYPAVWHTIKFSYLLLICIYTVDYNAYKVSIIIQIK